MVGAMACFIVNDSLVGTRSQTMPAMQLIFVRGVVATAAGIGRCAGDGRGDAEDHGRSARGWVAVRAIVDAVATMLFLVSLFHPPLANATAINMRVAAPSSRVLAALFLREPAGSVAVGGDRHRLMRACLIIIQPQVGGFDGYALVCVLSTVLLSVRDLVTRWCTPPFRRSWSRCRTRSPSRCLAGALSRLRRLAGIERVRGRLSGGRRGIPVDRAYYLIVVSTRRGDLSLIAPFRYTACCSPPSRGYVIWGDKPNALRVGGIALAHRVGNPRPAREPPRARLGRHAGLNAPTKAYLLARSSARISTYDRSRICRTHSWNASVRLALAQRDARLVALPLVRDVLRPPLLRPGSGASRTACAPAPRARRA